MAWIESHQALRTHRKTRRLCRALDISTVEAIGHLHCLWWWSLDNAPTGDITEIHDEEIADAGAWEGDPAVFVAALTSAGWIDQEDGHRELHDWWEFAGKLVKRRQDNAERMRQARRKDGDEPDPTRASHVQNTFQTRAPATNQPTNQHNKQTGGDSARAEESPPLEDPAITTAREIVQILQVGEVNELKAETLALVRDHPHLTVPSLAWSVRNYYPKWLSMKPHQRMTKFRQWVTDDAQKAHARAEAAATSPEEYVEKDYSSLIVQPPDEFRVAWERRNRELTLVRPTESEETTPTDPDGPVRGGAASGRGSGASSAG